MRIKVLVIFTLVLSIAIATFYIFPAFGQEYYIIGEGPIHDIERDNVNGQLIIKSGIKIYVINALNRLDLNAEPYLSQQQPTPPFSVVYPPEAE